MRAALTADAFDDKIEQSATLGARGHRELADTLVAWAERPHPDDEVSTADLLVAAGEQLQLADDDDEALELFRAAVDTGTVTVPDARGFVIETLLRLDRRSEAVELSEQLRRSRPSGAQTYALVGEAWEAHGDLEQANRWITRGVLLAEEQGAKMDWAMLLLGRLRVRRAIGFPPDDYDEAALDLLQASVAGRDEGSRDPRAVVSREGDQTYIDLF